MIRNAEFVVAFGLLVAGIWLVCGMGPALIAAGVLLLIDRIT